MAITNFSQVLLAQITDKKVAEMVANALRQEHQNDGAVIKRIDQKIDVSPHIIYKWYRAEKPPKSAHLLKLAGAYPQVLKGMLEMIGRGDIWELCIAENIPDKMYRELDKENVKDSIYRFKNDTVNIIGNSEISIKLNQRQLWFLGKLERGHKLKSEDITNKWSISTSSAKRDVATLLEHKFIHFIGACKNGHYKISQHRNI